jgi:hypothetical protein
MLAPNIEALCGRTCASITLTSSLQHCATQPAPKESLQPLCCTVVFDFIVILPASVAHLNG